LILDSLCVNISGGNENTGEFVSLRAKEKELVSMEDSDPKLEEKR